MKEDAEKFQRKLLNAQRQQDGADLSDEAITILQSLTTNESCNVDQIAHLTGIDRTRVGYWVGELEQMNMIFGRRSTVAPTRYLLAHRGRGLLVKRGLV
jgi:DNA-binding MarR family transcriptional regulator